MTYKKDLIFDVGMHRGEDARFYLAKGYQVVGFEANPDLVEYCNREFSKEISEGRITIVSGAIVPSQFQQPTTVQFYRNVDHSIWGTVVPRWAERNENYGAGSSVIEVPTVDLVDQLKKTGVPYYLKIDIEGMDHVCIEALFHVADKPAYVSYEGGWEKWKTEIKQLRQLRKNGYTSFQLVHQKYADRWIEPEKTSQGRYAGFEFSHGSSGLFGSDLNGRWRSFWVTAVHSFIQFHAFRWLGGAGDPRRNVLQRATHRILRLVTGVVVTGWYDIHAKHPS